jgi:hypothetical protein
MAALEGNQIAFIRISLERHVFFSYRRRGNTICLRDSSLAVFVSCAFSLAGGRGAKGWAAAGDSANGRHLGPMAWKKDPQHGSFADRESPRQWALVQAVAPIPVS